MKQRVIVQPSPRGWIVSATGGPLDGTNLVVADAVQVVNGRFGCRKFDGTLRAVWGVTHVDPEVYDHPDVFRALGLTTRFKGVHNEWELRFGPLGQAQGVDLGTPALGINWGYITALGQKLYGGYRR